MDNQQMNTPDLQNQGPATTRQAQLPYPPQQPFAKDPGKAKPCYLPIDSLFALLSLILGFLFIKALPVTKSSLGAMLCLLSWYLL